MAQAIVGTVVLLSAGALFGGLVVLPLLSSGSFVMPHGVGGVSHIASYMAATPPTSLLGSVAVKTFAEAAAINNVRVFAAANPLAVVHGAATTVGRTQALLQEGVVPSYLVASTSILTGSPLPVSVIYNLCVLTHARGSCKLKPSVRSIYNNKNLVFYLAPATKRLEGKARLLFLSVLLQGKCRI